MSSSSCQQDGAQGTFSKVKDNHNGTYTNTFTGTLDGSNTIPATVDGLPVAETVSLKIVGSSIWPNPCATVSSPSITVSTSTIVTFQAEYPQKY